jgi:hypothetical protein
MKFASKASVVAAAVLLLATSALAATNVVGAWKGRLEINAAAMPKGETKEEQKMMETMMIKLKKVVMNLQVNANKTFTLSAVDLDGHAQKASGTWKQSGNTVTLNITKEEGKPKPSSTKSLVMTVAKNGKSMTLVPKGAENKGKIIFVR